MIARTRRYGVLVLMALVSIGTILVVDRFEAFPAAADNRLQGMAAELMAEGTGILRDARLSRGLPIDREVDPNGTGLIGREVSPLMTTLGPLEVKRTTTNPNFAGVMVDLLSQCGVKPGDCIAAGISGSFPALALAIYCASETMDLELIAISSLGASTFGATDPEFTWLDMESALMDAGILSRGSVAASLGGENDGFENSLFPRAVDVALEAVRRNDMLLIGAGNFQEAVSERMNLYTDSAGSKPIRAFVNIGGAEANLGKCEAAYFLAPGIVRSIPRCPEEMQGVAFRMFEKGIPVINLLNIREIALRYGLPFDPIPLPEPGSGGLVISRRRSIQPILVLAVYCSFISLCIRLYRRLL